MIKTNQIISPLFCAVLPEVGIYLHCGDFEGFSGDKWGFLIDRVGIFSQDLLATLFLRLYSWTECLIVCALEHIGATFKVKWLFKKFLCAFVKQ